MRYTRPSVSTLTFDEFLACYPLVRGGADGEEETLTVPDDLSTLTGDELASLSERAQARYHELRAGYADLASAEERDAARAEMHAIADDGAMLDLLRVEGTRRAEVRAAEEAELADLDARIEPVAEDETPDVEETPDPPAPATPDTPADPVPAAPESPPEAPGEPEAVEPDAAPTPAPVQPQAVAASAAPAPRRAPVSAASVRPPATRTPASRPPNRRPVTITAAADNKDVSAGGVVADLNEVDRLIHGKWSSIRRSSGGADGEEMAVASMHWDVAEIIDFQAVQPGDVAALVAAGVTPEALTAAGICGPLNTIYDLPTLGSTRRPVFDGLPKADGSRGGVRWVYPPQLPDVAGAITEITAAQDLAGVTEKNCLEVDCGDVEELTVQAFSACLTFSNFTERFYPEQRPAWSALTTVAWARVAEARALANMAAAAGPGIGATAAFTTEATYGAVPTFMSMADHVIAAHRSAYRLEDEIFTAVLPFWLPNLLRSDLVRSARHDPSWRAFAVAEIEAMFMDRGADIIWQMDRQVLPNPVGGSLSDWPTNLEWFLFPRGTWAIIDGGRLDLGVVRDSTLNRANRWQTFFEGFETAIRLGNHSFAITTPLCADGTVAPAGTAISCPTP